jgi:hypothetical protein
MVNQEYISRCINYYETRGAYNEIIMPSKIGDWSKYQYHEFSQADGDHETVEWADYVLRLWQKEKTPTDRMDREVVGLVKEGRSIHNTTDSAIHRTQAATQRIKRNRDQDTALTHVSKRLSPEVGATGKRLTLWEISKRKLIKERTEDMERRRKEIKRAREQESQSD